MVADSSRAISTPEMVGEIYDTFGTGEEFTNLTYTKAFL